MFQYPIDYLTIVFLASLRIACDNTVLMRFALTSSGSIAQATRSTEAYSSDAFHISSGAQEDMNSGKMPLSDAIMS